MFFKKKMLRQQNPADTSRATVFSYYSSRREPGKTSKKTPAIRLKRLKWHYIPAYISFLMVLSGFVYIFSLSDEVQLVIREGQGSALVRSDQEYKSLAQTHLKSSFLNKSKLTLQKNQITGAINRAFPEVGNVNLSWSLLRHKPILEVSIRKAVFLFETSSTQVIVDSTGKVIGFNNEFPSLKENSLLRVIDQSDLQASASEQIINNSDSQYIQTVKQQLEGQNIFIENVTLPLLPRELHLKLQNEPYIIKFNLESDPLQSVGAFIVTYQKFGQEGIKKPVEYIDLRVDERVYIK